LRDYVIGRNQSTYLGTSTVLGDAGQRDKTPLYLSKKTGALPATHFSQDRERHPDVVLKPDTGNSQLAAYVIA